MPPAPLRVLAEAQRRGDVHAVDLLAAVEIGDRPRDAQDAVAAAGAQLAALVDGRKRPVGPGARSMSSCSRRASSWALFAAPVPRSRAACRARASSTRSRSSAEELGPARASSEPWGAGRGRAGRCGPAAGR